METSAVTRRVTVALVGLLVGPAFLAHADHLPPFPGPPVAIPGSPLGDPQGVVTSCRLAPRVFRSLATGPTDFCRGHLRFTPGALDCYQIADEVCGVYLPTSREWIETRRPLGPSVFPCPEGPAPPVCPRLTLQ